jgi:hypothetical protein
MEWKTVYYEICLCPRFPIRRDSKSKCPSLLFRENYYVFHNPGNQGLSLIGKKSLKFLLNGEMKSQVSGTD